MPRKQHKPEEIDAKLRQVDVAVAQGLHARHPVRDPGGVDAPHGIAMCHGSGV